MECRTLGEIANLHYGKMPDKELLGTGEYFAYSGYQIIERYPEVNIPNDTLIVVARGVGGTGDVKYVKDKVFLTNLSIAVEIDNKLISRYLYWKFYAGELHSLRSGSAQPQITIGDLERLEIKLPSEDVMLKIVYLLDVIDEKISINNRLNDYLAAVCETLSTKICQNPNGSLEDICSLIASKIPSSDADLKTYVSTESLLQNKEGRQSASSLPESGKVVSYKKGDTLVSNIRPYFKKIWYASNDGTCSNDVLVFRAHEKNNAAYLHSILRQDDFFDYVMRGAKGTKMPRGDKKQMMTFPITTRCQEVELAMFNSAIDAIVTNEIETIDLIELRDSLLPKLMSGEIDISSVRIGCEVH